MVAGRGVSARFEASDAIGPWMVTWIGASLANSGVGGAAASPAAAELASAVAAGKSRSSLPPPSIYGDRGTVCGIIWSPMISSQLSGPP